jgi:hypothetical protein
MDGPTDLNGRKFQLTFLRPAEMLMFATVSCDPPLGQTTVVPAGTDEVRFIVLVESSISFSNQPWEAVIWHNGHANSQWDELKLSRQDPPETPVGSDMIPFFSHVLSPQSLLCRRQAAHLYIGIIS